MPLSQLTPKEISVERILEVIADAQRHRRIVSTAGRGFKEDGSLHEVMTGDPISGKAILRLLRAILNLVDVLGRRFAQVGERDDSGRPLAPPTWTFVRQMDIAEIQQLVQPDSPFANEGFREIVEAVNVIDAK